MTPEDFVAQIIELYAKARELGQEQSEIFRGRKPSISAKAEDLLALYIKELLYNHDVRIFVDQPIRVPPMRQSRYIDLAVEVSGEITDLIDLKSDVGFNRQDVLSLVEPARTLLRQLAGQPLRLRTGAEKIEKTSIISANPQYHIVILTATNARKDMQDVLRASNQSSHGIQFYVLTAGRTLNAPNTQSAPKIGDVTILTCEFNRFDRALKRSRI